MTKKIFKPIKIEYIIFIVFAFYLSINFLFRWDPDFGWHIKTGELILKRGVPRFDWFSHTMSDFPWIDHEWLTNILMFKGYSSFGFLGLAIVSSLIVSSILMLMIPKIKKIPFKYYIIPLILGFFEINRYYYVRPQIITALFFVIFWLIFNKYNETKNFRLLWLIPVLMLLWVNLHGSFALGIFLLSLILGWQILLQTKIKKLLSKFFKLNFWGKPEIKRFSIIVFLSLIVTVINPYGIRIYEEVFRTIGDPYTRFFIKEWYPLLLRVEGYGISYIFFFILLTIINRNKLEGFSILVSYFFLIISFFNQRYFPLFLIISIPLFAEAIFITIKDKEKFKSLKLLSPLVGKVIFALFIIFISIILLTETMSNFLLWDFQSQGDETFTMDGVVSYLQKNSKEKQMFNEYNIGGLLIWKVPEKKVFIDGRMPSWQKNNTHILDEENRVVRGDFKKIFEKYNIKQVVLINNFEFGMDSKSFGLQERLEKWFFSYRDKIFNLPNKNLLLELKSAGWKTAYYDDFYVVMEKD